jgi:hypothetical protein
MMTSASRASGRLSRARTRVVRIGLPEKPPGGPVLQPPTVRERDDRRWCGKGDVQRALPRFGRNGSFHQAAPGLDELSSSCGTSLVPELRSL